MFQKKKLPGVQPLRGTIRVNKEVMTAIIRGTSKKAMCLALPGSLNYGCKKYIGSDSYVPHPVN